MRLHSHTFCVYSHFQLLARPCGLAILKLIHQFWYEMRKATGRNVLAYYENVFIARQDISATQVNDLTETFTKVVSENDGKIVKTENWGLRSLAYRIKKNRKGHYVMLNIDAPAAAIHEMERQMRINEDILRYLTIKVDALEEGPSVMMNTRTRDERPRSYDIDYTNQISADAHPEEPDLAMEEEINPVTETGNDDSEDNSEGIIL